jgi:hypothetical protein
LHGHDPLDVIRIRRAAEIFEASFGLNPAGRKVYAQALAAQKERAQSHPPQTEQDWIDAELDEALDREAYRQDRASVSPYPMLLSGMSPDATSRYRREVLEQWPDLADLAEAPDQCRSILRAIANENIEQLEATCDEHEQNAEQNDRDTADRLSLGEGPAAERRFGDLLRAQNAYLRVHTRCERCHEKRMKDEPGFKVDERPKWETFRKPDYVGPKPGVVDPTWRAACHPDEFLDRSAARGTRHSTGGEEAGQAGAWDQERASGVDAEYEERIARLQYPTSAEFADPSPVLRPTSPRGGEVDAGVDETRGEAGSGDEVSPAGEHAAERPAVRSDAGASERGGLAEAASLVEGGLAAERPVERSDAGALGREISTSEAVFDENVRSSESQDRVMVEANFGDVHGLDKPPADAEFGGEKGAPAGRLARLESPTRADPEPSGGCSEEPVTRESAITDPKRAGEPPGGG